MTTEVGFWAEALQYAPVCWQVNHDDLDTKDLLENILGRVTDLYNDAKERDLLFRRWNGSVVVLHDVLGKIRYRIQMCRSIAEEMSTNDSSDLNIPLVAMKDLLRIGLDDGSTLRSVLEGLDTAANVMAQCSILKILHAANMSDTGNPNMSHLRKIVVAEYGIILKFLDRATRFCLFSAIGPTDIDTTEQMEQRSWSLQQELIGMDADFIRLALTLKQDLELHGFGTLQKRLLDIFDDLRCPIARVPDDIWQIEAEFDTDIRHEFLNWLSTVPSSTHLQYESQGIIRGTGDWLLQHPQFRIWQDSSTSDIFWLSGIPGSGKSKLTAKVAQYYLNQNSKSQIPFAFFACSQKGDDQRQNDPHEVLLSIVRQLSGGTSGLPLRGDLIDEYVRKREVAKDQGQSIPRLTANKAIARILSITQVAPAVIIIDALDEANKEQRHMIFEALTNIISSSANVVKIFISSRRDPDITSALQSFSGLENIEDLNHKDIDTFIECELDRKIEHEGNLGSSVSKSLRDEVMTILSKKAQGMFRWVELSLTVLFDSHARFNEDGIRATLGTLPSTLQEQYQFIYDDIMESSSSRASVARRTFAWILAAQRPMSTDEYIAAISMDENGKYVEQIDTKLILEITRNLIRETSMAKSQSLKTFQVAHLSVREFLEGVSELSPTEVHGTALRRCLHEFFATNDESSYRLRRQVQPYSKYLFEHARLTTLKETHSDLTTMMLKFLWNSSYEESSAYSQWIHLFKEHEDYRFKQWDDINEDDRLFAEIFGYGKMYVPAINLTCRYGLLAVLYQLPVERVSPWDYDPEKYSSPPLYEATSHGQYAVAQWILTNAIYPADEGVRHVTGLYRAAWDGNEPIVRLLLAHGADPLWGTEKTAKFSSTPLCMGFSTPLHRANNGKESRHVDKTGTIRAMIDHIESQQYVMPERFSHDFNWKVEALYQALQTNQEQIASLLLDQVSGLHYRTSVSSSSVNQIRFWWNRRRFYRGDSFPNVPINPSLLHVAVYGSKPSMIQKVLTRCSLEPHMAHTYTDAKSVNPVSQDDGSPEAPSNDIPESSDCRFSALDIRDGLGRTPLHYLMDREEPGASQILIMLEEAGADMSVVSDQGIAAIHVAAAIGALDFVLKLVKENESIVALDKCGANALHYAALGDGSASTLISLLEILTSTGLSLTSRDHHGNTPIHYAAAANNLAFLRASSGFYVAQDVPEANVFTENRQEADGVNDAAKEVGKAQSAQPATLFTSLRNDKGQTPLHIIHYAPGRDSSTDGESLIQHKDQAVVHFLIDAGTQVNAQDLKGCTPLMELATKYSSSVPALEELWSAGARSEIVDNLGRTVMHYSAQRSLQDETKLKTLIDRGVAVDTQDFSGDTPLHLAASCYLNVRAIGLLVRNGAPVNCRSLIMTTPLHYAVDVSMIEALVRTGAELEARDHRGRTPLLVVLEKDSLYDHIRDLYKNQNDPNDIRNKTNLVRCLLKHGADPAVCDSSGRSVLSRAKDFAHSELTDMLSDAIAKKENPTASEQPDVTDEL